MEFRLKEISKSSIPEALEKVERYRLLNEPREAESICLDVLRVEPENHEALIALLLSLTDQVGSAMGGAGVARAIEEARKLLPRLRTEYERAYYSGIICERRAKARLEQGGPRSGFVAYEGLSEAMNWYEKAEAVRPEGDDLAIIRWNTCARLIMSSHEIRPEAADQVEPALE